ncbi:MAG: hypothetical protein AB8D78_15855 [Akkermansiaceae bacterium]
MSQPPVAPSPAKKGMPVIAWLGIGCGGLILIVVALLVYGFIKAKSKFDEFAQNPSKAAAELVVKMNPELEMVSQDEANGKMTVRMKNGDEMTLSYEDISEGKFSIKDANGNVSTFGSTDLSKVPEWVPIPAEHTDPISMYHGEDEKEFTGQFSLKSEQNPEDLRSYYEAAASDLGLNSSSNRSMNVGDTTSITINFSGGKRSLDIVITAKPNTKTQVNTNYSEKK